MAWRVPSPSLLTRVALGLALAGLLPAGLLAYRLIGINRVSMADQVDKTHILTARKTAEGVGAFLDTRIALAEGLAANPALRDPRSEAARSLLAENLQAWSGLGVVSVSVVDPSGEPVVTAQLADPEVKRRLARALERPRPEEVAVYRFDDGLLTRVRTLLPGEVAALWVISDGEPLVRALEAFELGEEAEVALVDAEGQPIVGSVDGFPATMLEQARSGWIQGADAGFRLASGEEESVGAYAPVPQAGWSVLSRQPARVARASEFRMRWQTRWALGAAALLVAMLSAVAYHTVVRPIRTLVQAQRRLVGGTIAGGGNEIDQLRSSFQLLEKRMKERESLDEVFLGRYQVNTVVGSGAMGTVFRGFDPKLQRRVALKTIRLDADLPKERREELIARLMEEAVMVAQFSHQHIVSVYDVEDRSEAAFVAMEYIDGESLESLVWREGRLDQDQVVPLGAAIARGLAAAHAHDLVHRDVKPANILLGRDGSIKVTDFGISELITAMKGQPDVVFGTPGYLPPESLEGKGYDVSGDLFALGAVLYFCLTGRRPFEGTSIREVIRHTLAGRLTPPRRLVAGLDRELDALVVELLHKDAERRPKDAAAVAERLEAVAARRGARWTAPDPPSDSTPPRPAVAGTAQFVPTHRLHTDRDTLVVPPDGEL